MPALAWLAYFVNIGAIAGFSSVVLVMLLGQSRIFYSMSRDGLAAAGLRQGPSEVPDAVRDDDRPGFVCARSSPASSRSHLLGEMRIIGTLLAFVIVCVGVMDPARTRDPNCRARSARRSCRSCRSLGILICGCMMYGLPGDTGSRLIVWLAIGLVDLLPLRRCGIRAIRQAA